MEIDTYGDGQISCELLPHALLLSGKFLADSNKWWFYVLFLKLQWPFIFWWIFISVIIGTWDLAERPFSVRSQNVCLPSSLVNVCLLMRLHWFSSLTVFFFFFSLQTISAPLLAFDKTSVAPFDPVFRAWISTWCQRWKTDSYCNGFTQLVWHWACFPTSTLLTFLWLTVFIKPSYLSCKSRKSICSLPQELWFLNGICFPPSLPWLRTLLVLYPSSHLLTSCFLLPPVPSVSLPGHTPNLPAAPTTSAVLHYLMSSVPGPLKCPYFFGESLSFNYFMSDVHTTHSVLNPCLPMHLATHG